jgi:flagellar L-ring protein precursor FlgH
MTRLEFIALVVACVTLPVAGQSSSLYVQQAPAPAPQAKPDGTVDRLSPRIASVSYAAVRMPEPKRFAINDLISIIIRESSTNDSSSSLETNKETTLDGEISSFPNLNLKDLLNFQLTPSEMKKGSPKVGIDMSKEFEGDGKAMRRDSVSDRVTARIIDVKPNGNLVLEARKFVRTDKEELQLVLSGTCRSTDVSADNAVLSTQLFDLHLDKQSKGELRDAAKKGLLTKFFEGLFAF